MLVKMTLKFCTRCLQCWSVAPFQVNSNSKYGDSTRPFSYGIERCYGWESSISDCKLKSHAVCFRSQAAGVICRDGMYYMYSSLILIIIE